MSRIIKSHVSTALYEGFLVLWLGFIYTNSLKSKADSAAQSEPMEGVLRRLLALLGFEGDSEGIAEIVVRKAAHIFEFFVLALLLYLLIRSLGYDRRQCIALTAVLAVTAAALDETLQLFSHRGARITDVFIDSLGILVAFLVVKIGRNARKTDGRKTQTDNEKRL